MAGTQYDAQNHLSPSSRDHVQYLAELPNVGYVDRLYIPTVFKDTSNANEHTLERVNEESVSADGRIY